MPGSKPRLTPEERARRVLEIEEYYREYRKRNAASLVVKKREYGRRVRLEGIEAYGGKCSCCGESTVEFLTLEHLKGRKNDDLVPAKAGKAWQRLKALGWPKDGYTVLCFNCNCAKGTYGRCPHERIKDDNDR